MIRTSRARRAPRVGLFGKLGTGNIGNDASMEAILGYLRAEHPDAVVDAMCGGPERIAAEYGLGAVPLLWYQRYEQRLSGRPATVLKVLGKGVDAIRTAAWVRRHDVVIVPGMGVLEATMPTRAMGFPYSLFLLSACGRLFGAKVALVSVGANVMDRPLTRWLSDTTARLAYYRSYRDEQSRGAMRERGVAVSADHVYPDLAFSLPDLPYEVGDQQTVAVGVMAYHGSDDDDPGQADAIYAAYLATITGFIRWLLDGGRTVRLFIGDANGSDEAAVQDILADLRVSPPGLEPGRVVAEQIRTFAELMRTVEPAGFVVATRFHNVICAVKLGKPTISLGYAAKHRALMADMGLTEFCQDSDALDVDLLIKQFTELESRAAELRPIVAERSAAKARRLGEQFAELSEVLFSQPRAQPPTASAASRCITDTP